MENKKIYLITFIAANGGLLYGLNMAGISGCVDSIQQIFGLSSNSIGLAVSILTLGCLVGSFFVGQLADIISRRGVFILSAIIMALTSLGLFYAQSIVWVIVLRFNSGLVVGAVSVVSPMYISEISPSDKRGTLVSFNQFAITIGILFAYLINFYFKERLAPAVAWHYMLAVPFVFSIVFLVLALFILPHSPRWLMAKGLKAKARDVLYWMMGKKDGRKEYNALQTSFTEASAEEKVVFSDIFRGNMGKVVLLGTLLAVLQQIMGINAVVNYAPVLFKQMGSATDPFMQSIIIGVVNVVFTVVALGFVDRLGRKKLLLIGSVGSTLALLYLVIATVFNMEGIGMSLALFAYIAFFAATWSPIMWVVISEIYPNRIRSTAMSFSTAMSWAFSFLIIQFSPGIIAALGVEFLFGLFAIFGVFSYFFVLRYIPETKGKSLEEIEHELHLD